MPNSEHDENGVNSSSGQCIDLLATLPIKKRRYPLLIKPPSEEKSNLSVSIFSNAVAPIKKRKFLQACSVSNEVDVIKQESSVVVGGNNLSVTSSEINEKGESVSLELSLSKEKCSIHSSNTDAKSDDDDTDTTRDRSSRVKWDLNTTMDSWDEGSDASSVKISVAEKELMCSTRMAPSASVVTVNGPAGKCADPNDLCLSSCIEKKYVEEPSRISVKLNSDGDTSELTSTEVIVGQLENYSRAEQVDVEKVCDKVCSNSEGVPLVTVAVPMVDATTDLTNLCLKNSSVVTKNEVDDDDHDGCRLKLMNKPLDPQNSGEGCASDEEKIILSPDMLDDDCYDSDFESDENHAVTVAVDTERYIEDDDYEDGELREPLEPSKVEDDIFEVREVERLNSCNYGNKLKENDGMTVVRNEMISKNGVDFQMHEKSGKVVNKNVWVQEPLDVDKSDIAADKRPVNVLQRKPLDLLKRIGRPETQETEHSDYATDGSHVIDVKCADEVVKTTDMVVEGSANANYMTKDFSNSGNQGRIQDLSRAVSSSSPSKTRPISGRSLPTRAGRDEMSDTLDGDKLYRGRFSRERHQDMFTRNSRLSFGQGRGRVNSRIHGDWQSKREYPGEFYNGPSQQFRRGGRSKYSSAIAETDMEYNNVGHDDSYVVHGRLGRNTLNDGSYIAPRRRSPGEGRGGIQMGHRNPRPIAPNSRCVGGDGSDLGDMRHSEKFMRGFDDDTLDSVYNMRPQQFDGSDGRFSRGRGRSLSSRERRGGLSRMQSKSPIRSRSRSPGQWLSPRRRSPRRRSPDGYGGHSKVTHRKSASYKVDKMRPPDQPIFTGERVVRRHGSPPFTSRPSNDMRDTDSARDHGHPRSVVFNKSSSGRILTRNNRRFDVLDPQDRADNNNEYFDGRMLELDNGEGNGDERRRFGERQGPVPSFRSPYNTGNNAGGENFHLNTEGGPRHYRLCSDDSDFHVRGNNLREKDFGSRSRGRTGNGPPRRTRNMDEQEENFRHSEQVWSDDNFDDKISQAQRKRF